MVQSSGPVNKVLSVFKRNNSKKTPAKLGDPAKVDASPLTKRLFSFSPAKAARAPPSCNKRAQRVDNDGELIPAGVTFGASASRFAARGTNDDDDASNIKVVVRIRPRNDREASLGGAICIQSIDEYSVRLVPPAEIHSFSFDHVAPETASQADIYETAGRPVVDSCLQGFNGCLLAYGQTGSGKTYSMLGACDSSRVSVPDDHRRGLIQRIFEHLFAELQSQAEDGVQATVSCSFLEIYNESISDLLYPGSTGLSLREDAKRCGVFVEGLVEERVTSVDHVTSLLHTGISNRRVGETQMNERSSRSHSVLTAVVERRLPPSAPKGVPTVVRSRLHLVDLAGSERQKTSGAAGERLKEASSINKSLSTLGLVIMSLVDQQQGRQRHVPYRDSKLTFLLQDSLGGNAKTVLVATISPAAANAAETLSTLRFADGAKRIKNKAVVNEDAVGDVNTLRMEIRRLKEELASKRSSTPSTPDRSSKLIGSSLPTPPPTTAGRGLGGEGARRALVSALRREEAAVAEVAALQERVGAVQALVAAKEADLSRTQMMLKLKESRLARVSGVSAPVSDDELATSLRSEIDILKSRLESHPEVKRFAVENLHLAQEVKKLQGMVDHAELAALGTDVAVLRREMLGMAEALEAAQEAAELACAESETSRATKEKVEALLIEAQTALASRGDQEVLNQRIATLSAENDELKLAASEVATLRGEVNRMVTYAGGLEAECEELKSSLAVKTTELKDLDTAYQGVAEQLATAWEEISALESEKGELQQSLMDASAKHVSEVNILVATATENAAKAADAITQAQRDLLERDEQLEKNASQLELLKRELDSVQQLVMLRESELAATVTATADLKDRLEKESARAISAESAAESAEKRAVHNGISASEQAQRADDLAEGLRVEATALAEARSELAAQTANRALLETTSASLNKELQDTKRKVVESEAEVERLRANLATVQHRLTEVEDLLEQSEDAKAELSYELSDKSASLTEMKERFASSQAVLEIAKEAKAALERRKAELKTELDTVSKSGAVAERERYALSQKVHHLEEELHEARAKIAAATSGPLEQEQQLLLIKAELKETKEQLTRARENVAKLTAGMKEKDVELAAIRSEMAVEVNEAAQQVQELLAAQARAEAAEARATELSRRLQPPSLQL